MLWAFDGTFADVSRLAISSKRSGASPPMRTTRPVSTRQTSESFSLNGTMNSGDSLNDGSTPDSPFMEENQKQENGHQSSIQKARTDALAQLDALAASGALFSLSLSLPPSLSLSYTHTHTQAHWARRWWRNSKRRHRENSGVQQRTRFRNIESSSNHIRFTNRYVCSMFWRMFW